MKLTELKTILISPDVGMYSERKTRSLKLLNTLGFKRISHYKSTQEKYPDCLTLANIKILEDNLDDEPILIVEDDIGWTGEQLEIDISFNFDALYIGLSKAAGCTLRNYHDGYIDYDWITNDLIKINNMLGTHAIVYRSRRYKEAVINILKEALEKNMNTDVAISRIQRRCNVIALSKPIFFQDDDKGNIRDFTSFTIVKNSVLVITSINNEKTVKKLKELDIPLLLINSSIYKDDLVLRKNKTMFIEQNNIDLVTLLVSIKEGYYENFVWIDGEILEMFDFRNLNKYFPSKNKTTIFRVGNEPFSSLFSFTYNSIERIQGYYNSSDLNKINEYNHLLFNYEESNIKYSHDCTIVSAYYPIKSKFPYQQYIQWITNFMQLKKPIVLFTCRSMVDELKNLRSSNLPLCIISMEFEHLDTWKKYQEVWKEQYKIDREKDIHSPELYSVWAEKPFFVEKAISINPFNTNFFFWCDIGAFRDDSEMYKFREKFPITNLFRKDKMLFSLVETITIQDKTVFPDGIPGNFYWVDRIVGGLWGGDITACLRWRSAYQTMLEKYFNSGRFAGKDQSVMLSTLLQDPSLGDIIKPKEDGFWFFLEYFLSDNYKESSEIG